MANATLIVGGGLSGLHTAFELHRAGRDFLLVEARDRLGGRILSKFLTKGSDAGGFDLGPAWFWPGQRRIAALLEDLGLRASVLDQYAVGDELVERGPGDILRGRFGVTMAGSYRLRGGMGQLIDSLAEKLPADRVRLGTRAVRLTLGQKTVEIELEGPDGAQTLQANRVVLALPPRVALETLSFEPGLAADRRKELQSIPTWMASQGKCVAVYDSPFWRLNGLSGDAVSYLGPLGEIHDVTPSSDDEAEQSGAAALFGFFAVPAAARRNLETLKAASVRQLTRLFGEEASRPTEVWLKDWATDPMTVTAEDLQGPAAHSLIQLSRPVEPGWSGRLIWSGSESAGVAERHNGYLEGALEASWRTLNEIAAD